MRKSSIWIALMLAVSLVVPVTSAQATCDPSEPTCPVQQAMENLSLCPPDSTSLLNCVGHATQMDLAQQAMENLGMCSGTPTFAECGVQAAQVVPVATPIMPLGFLVVTPTDTSIPALTASCGMYLYGNFSGFRNTVTGIVYGSWSFYAHTNCSIPMQYLSAGSFLYYGGTRVASGPLDSCSLPSPCQAVHSAGTYACAVCNGTWVVQTKHRVVVPAGFAWAISDSRCTGTATDFTCTLTKGATL